MAVSESSSESDEPIVKPIRGAEPHAGGDRHESVGIDFAASDAFARDTRAIAMERDRLTIELAGAAARRYEDLDALVAQVGALEAEYRMRLKSISRVPAKDPTWVTNTSSSDLPEELVGAFRLVIGPLGGAAEVVVAAPAVIESRFSNASVDLTADVVAMAQAHDLVDADRHLTPWGMLLLRRLAESEAGSGDL
jgi:hypothetical protein